MRVTSNTFSNNLLEHLNRLGVRQSRLQNQAATGQKVQSPGDDPGAMQRVMDWQAEARSVAQYQRNIGAAQETATAGYSAVTALKKISDRAGEIAILADGMRTPEELATYASEVTQLIKQAVQIGNTRQNGSYLFSGTLSDQPAFALATDAAGAVTSVTYQGNASVAEIEIAQGVLISAQVPGANAGGAGQRGLFADSNSGADLFNHLISLQNNLAAGNVSAIATTDRPALAADEDNILFHASRYGVVQSTLEATSETMTERDLNLGSQVSAAANADLAETMVQFSATQTAYQAALQSSARILNLSLMDFLR